MSNTIVTEYGHGITFTLACPRPMTEPGNARQLAWPPATEWQEAYWTCRGVRVSAHRRDFIPRPEILSLVFPGVDVSTRPGGLYTRIEEWFAEALSAAHQAGRGLPFAAAQALSDRVFTQIRAMGPEVTGLPA